MYKRQNRGEAFSKGDRSLGRQLPYVPVYSAAVTGRLAYKSWRLLYKWCYYSERFTTSNNDVKTKIGRVLPYFMSDVSLEKLFSFRWGDFSVKVAVKNLLDEKKLNHTECVMYRTVSNDFTPDEEFDYDMLVFFSPAGVTSLKKNFPDFDQKEIKIGTFGSTTAQAVRDAGLRLDLEAPTVQAPSMTAALDMFIKENNK